MAGQLFGTRIHPLRSLAAVLAPVAVLAGSVALLNPGDALERGLASAAAAESRLIAEAAPLARTRSAVSSRAFEEGSEGFWLTRTPEQDGVARVAWTAPVAAGDRVVVNFGPYDREILDVVAVEEDSTSMTRIDTGDGKGPRYVVVGRRLSQPGDGLVRLTVDSAGRGLTTIVGDGDRAL